MSKDPSEDATADLEAVKSDVQRLRIMIESEVLRLRQIIREYVIAEDEYANAWSYEDADFQLVKERWRKAWEALNIEAERID